MAIDLEKLDIQHDPQRGRFTIPLGDAQAELDYFIQGKDMVFTHTGVPAQHEGQGIGSRLAKAGLEYARQQGLHPVAWCSFIEVYLRRHPEYLE